MSEHEQHPDEGGDEQESRGRRLLRSFARPFAAALLGLLLGAACSQLPESLRAPCEMVSHLLPAACGEEKIP